jgi:hypothetical protein
MLTVALAGCATPYQKYTGQYGYTDTSLGADIFEVRYVGRESTSPARAKYYATVRAAELTTERGRRFFEILDIRESVRVGARVATDRTTETKRVGEKTVAEDAPAAVAHYEQPVCVLEIRVLAQRTPTSLDAFQILDEARREGVKISPRVEFQLQTAQ